MGVSLVLLVLMVNLVVFSYGRGVVRAALDEGVRAGARVSAAAATCQQRAEAVLADLLGGSLGDGVTVTCSQTPQQVHATADVRFAAWLPTVADWRFTLAATARRSTGPGP